MLTECLLLGLTEEYFWKSTPRNIVAIIDQKRKIEETEQKNQAIYIACYVWGKDPDEMKKNEDGPVAGRDVPISESALRGFF